VSYVKDGRYNAKAGSWCRQNGHVWDGARCSGCRLLRDDYDAPYVPTLGMTLSDPGGAKPVGQMVPIMAPMTR
jgi:hypothetical protein